MNFEELTPALLILFIILLIAYGVLWYLELEFAKDIVGYLIIAVFLALCAIDSWQHPMFVLACGELQHRNARRPAPR